jgi:hypothetical protein
MSIVVEPGFREYSRKTAEVNITASYRKLPAFEGIWHRVDFVAYFTLSAGPAAVFLKVKVKSSQSPPWRIAGGYQRFGEDLTTKFDPTWLRGCAAENYQNEASVQYQPREPSCSACEVGHPSGEHRGGCESQLDPGNSGVVRPGAVEVRGETDYPRHSEALLEGYTAACVATAPPREAANGYNTYACRLAILARWVRQ